MTGVSNSLCLNRTPIQWILGFFPGRYSSWGMKLTTPTICVLGTDREKFAFDFKMSLNVVAVVNFLFVVAVIIIITVVIVISIIVTSLPLTSNTTEIS
jgi:hypothetical protein